MLFTDHYLSIREVKKKERGNDLDAFGIESFLFDSMEDEDVHSIGNYDPRKYSLCWMILYYIFCVLTLCIYPYILSYKPVWREHLKSKSSSMDNCDLVIVKSSYDGQRTACLVRKYNNIRYFTYRYVNFVIYEDGDGEFIVKKVKFELNRKPSARDFIKMEAFKEQRKILFGKNQIKIELETNIIRLFISELMHPFFLFQIFSVILWMCDNYYYYAGVILFFAAVSIFMTIFSLRRNRLEMKKRFESQNTEVTRLSSSSDDEESVVLEKVDTRDLLPGDIIEVGENGMKRIPCDIVVLESECYVNEAILTGESKPILKIESEVGSELSKNNVVYGGTKLVKKKGTVLGMVYKTGFQSKKGELIASILFTKPEVSFEFHRDSVKFILIMCVIGFISFCVSLVRMIMYRTPVFDIIKRGLDVYTIIIPPALPIAIEEGMSVSIRQLKGVQISCLFPEKINVAGKIRTFCFDKTGTLTEDELSLEKTIEGSGEDIDNDEAQRDPSVDMLRCFGYCHSLTKVDKVDLEDEDEEEESNRCCSKIFGMMKFVVGKIVPESWKKWSIGDKGKLFSKKKEYVLEGDPLDLCLFNESGMDIDPETNEILESIQLLEENEEVVEVEVKNEEEEEKEGEGEAQGKEEEVEAKADDVETAEPKIIPLQTKSTKLDQIFAFESKFQRMTVVTSDGVVYTKGSPEMVSKLCIPSTIPPNFSEVLEKYAKRGYRILACSMKVLKGGKTIKPPSNHNTSSGVSGEEDDEGEEEDEEEQEGWEKKNKVVKYEREDVEKEMDFIGFAIVTNNLKEKSVETIGVLKNAKIDCLMVTGDNPLTATTVALKCNILEKPELIPLDQAEEEGGERREEEVNIGDEMESIPLNATKNRVVMIKKKAREDELIFVDYESGKRITPPKDFQVPETLKEREEDDVFLEEGGGVNEHTSILRNESFKGGLYDAENEGGGSRAIVIEEDSEDGHHHEEDEKEADPRVKLLDKKESPLLVVGDDIDLSLPEAEFDETDQFVITGPAYRIFREDRSGLYHQLLTSARLRVFSRMSPFDKFNLVCDIRDRRKEMGYVGFCGDGTNDCAAIKRSDCGVSVALNSEVSLVSHFCLSLSSSKKNKSCIDRTWRFVKYVFHLILTPLKLILGCLHRCLFYDPEAEAKGKKKKKKKYNITSVDCVPFILKTSKSSLQTSFSIFKFIIIYSVVQTIVVLWLYFIGNNLGDPMFLYVDILIIFPVCILMGETPPKDELVEYIPKSSLISVGVIGSLLYQTCCYLLLSFICWMVLITSPGFEFFQTKVTNLDYEACEEVSTMFFVCVFGTLSGAVAYTITRPFKKSVFETNMVYVCILVGLYAVSTILMFFDNKLTQWLIGTALPTPLAIMFCLVFYLHLLVVYLVEYVFFSFLQVENS